MILISIIIPCYNVEHYITECIESVLTQTYKEIELICVDNNSTDNTFNILFDYEKKYSDKIIITKELKKGAPAARNKGLSLAKGEWIQFLDADDRLLSDKIKDQIKEIQSFKGPIDILISPLTRILTSSKIVHIEIAKEIWMGLITSRAGSTCSNLYRKEFLNKIAGWDETRKSSQEAWLLFTLLKNGAYIHFFNKDETIVNERSEGSISKTNRGENWYRYLIFRKEVWDYLKKEKKLSSQLELKIKGYIFDSIRMIYKTDPIQAKKLFKDIVIPNFTPVYSDATSYIYIYFFRILGFSTTEKLFSVLK